MAYNVLVVDSAGKVPATNLPASALTTSTNWSTVAALPGAPAVIAAGATQTLARDAVLAAGVNDTEQVRRYTGSAWPSLSLPTGYTGAVKWDSIGYPTATAPTSMRVDKDVWFRDPRAVGSP